jgi:hypothetical protein
MAIPPLAIAFLVGYAVEAFFSRLDDLIRKLKAADNTEASPATQTSPTVQAAE